MNYIISLIHLFFAFIALSSGSVFASLYNKKYEEIVPITIMGSILFLYIFYIFNILFIGLYIIWGIMLLMYIYFLYKFFKSNKKRKKEILSNIFTPGFIIFILVYALITLVTRGRFVLLWDELRLWGAYPKILYYNGTLQLGNNVQLMDIMQSYEPGMPLFQFFFAKSAGCFTESNLFLSYALVGAAPLILLTKNITWKKWYLIPVFAFLIFMIPLSLANSNLDFLTYYNTLYIDCMLGIYFCFTLYLSITKKVDKKIKYLLFVLGIGTLTLLKDTGILFAIISTIAFALNEFIFNKENKKIKKTKRIALILMPLITIIFIFGSWKIVQKIYDTDNMYSEKMIDGEIKDFFTSPTQKQKTLVSNFIQEVNNSSIINSSSEKITPLLTYKNLIILLFISFLCITFLKPKKERKQYITTFSLYFIGSLIFTIGTLFVYLFSLHIVTCFPRYMSTIFVAGFLLLYLIIIDDLLKNEIINEKYKFFIGILLMIIIMIMPIKFPAMGGQDTLNNYNLEGLDYSTKIAKYVNSNEKYSLIFANNHFEDLSYAIYDHQIYMDLIDEGFPFQSNIFVNSEMTENELLNKISDLEANYIYFIIIDDFDKEIFTNILNDNIEKSTLFKVNKENQNISLEKIE